MANKQSRLIKLRERAEAIVEAKVPILHFTRLDVEAVVAELRVHQLELELQLDDIQQSYAALESAQKRYTKLFDNSPIAYIAADRDGLIVSINRAASQLLGVEQDKIAGNLFTEFVTPDFQDIFYFSWRTLWNERQQQCCELELQSNTGTRVPVLMNSETPEETSTVVYIALTNISSIKQSDAAFVRSSGLAKELNQIRLNMLRAIAPEFYRPLGAILSSVELLYKHSKRLTEKKKEQLYQTCRNLLWYLNDTIQDAANIQELDRHKLLRLEAFDLLAFTQQIITDMELVATGQKIILEIENQDDKSTIVWDMNIYRRILMNLLNGLLKSTNRAVRCRLTIREADFSLRIDSQSSSFTEEELDLMFEAFFQGTNSEFLQGRGNGLLLAYYTIHKHGGSIRYKSHEGKGISFVVDLPKRQANPSPYRQ